MSQEVQALGEDCPDEFFRYVVEPLSDSFAVRDAKVYQRIMRAWIPPRPTVSAQPPDSVERVSVLSRVTLGADIKITSVMLDAAKKRYPEAEIVFVAAKKAAQLFAGDSRVGWMEAEYPRSGSIASRLNFVRELRFDRGLDRGIVIDPDSRLTQLGLELPCNPESYFHFPSRTYKEESDCGLGALATAWTEETFGVAGSQYLAPLRVAVDKNGQQAAVSLGVGENAAKRVGGNFEGDLLRLLASRYEVLHVDRGAGGEERERVISAVREAGPAAAGTVRFCDGSFADFASIVSQCDAYFGYDSAGQHAAAAAGVPVTTIFAGAPSERFRMRWRPEGNGLIRVIAADGMSPAQVLEALH